MVLLNELVMILGWSQIKLNVIFFILIYFVYYNNRGTFGGMFETLEDVLNALTSYHGKVVGISA